MNRIAIIGAGAMGSGIAQIAATHGHEVLIYDAQHAATQRARDAINTSLNKLVSKGKLTDQEAVAIIGRLYFVDQLSSAAECDLIIEAIREDERDKQELFQKLSHTISPNTILASNTSSLSITRLATAALRLVRRYVVNGRPCKVLVVTAQRFVRLGFMDECLSGAPGV